MDSALRRWFGGFLLKTVLGCFASLSFFVLLIVLIIDPID